MINNNILFKCNILIHFDEKKQPSEVQRQACAWWANMLYDVELAKQLFVNAISDLDRPNS